MNYWLFKSEPDTFSIDDLKSRLNKTEHWDGVRNFQVRNMIRDEIKAGDLAFFYHSSCTPPGIVGTMKIIKNAYPDHSALDFQSKYYDPLATSEKPRWYMVDVKFLKKFPRMLTLDEIKSHSALKKMPVAQRGNRLSITRVSAAEWKIILKLVELL